MVLCFEYRAQGIYLWDEFEAWQIHRHLPCTHIHSTIRKREREWSHNWVPNHPSTTTTTTTNKQQKTISGLGHLVWKSNDKEVECLPQIHPHSHELCLWHPQHRKELNIFHNSWILSLLLLPTIAVLYYFLQSVV